MKPDINQLKSLISTTKPQNLLTILVDSLDMNSAKRYQKDIDKFIKIDQDYIILIVKR